MLSGFKQFIMRGNVIDLAVAVVIGTAFTAVVTAVVEGLIHPLIAAVFGKVELDDVWVVEFGGAGPGDPAQFMLGMVVGAAINFLLVALAIYGLIMLPSNRLAARRKAGEEPEPEAPAEDVLLLQEIRDLLAARRDV